METTFMNTEDSKMIEPHKFVFNLSQRLNLRSSNIPPEKREEILKKLRQVL